MRDVVADTGEGLNERFHLVEHSVDYFGKIGEGIVAVPVRQPFTQIAGDDTLHPLVDFDDTSAGTSAQRPADGETKKGAGKQTQRERITQYPRDLPDLIDVSPDHKHVAILQSPRDQARRLLLPSIPVRPVDHSGLRRVIDPKIGRQLFQVTGDPAAI